MHGPFEGERFVAEQLELDAANDKDGSINLWLVA